MIECLDAWGNSYITIGKFSDSIRGGNVTRRFHEVKAEEIHEWRFKLWEIHRGKAIMKQP
jgi:hypothetical protein